MMDDEVTGSVTALNVRRIIVKGVQEPWVLSRDEGALRLVRPFHQLPAWVEVEQPLREI